MACPGLDATPVQPVSRRIRSRLLPLLLLPAAVLPGVTPLLPPTLAQERGTAPVSSGSVVRVLLAESPALTLTALDRPLRIQSTGLVIPAGQSAQLLLQPDGSVLLDDGRSRQPLPPAPSYWLQAFSLRPVIAPAAADPQALTPETGGEPAAGPQGDFQLQQRRYRGQLQLLVGRAGLQAVNHVPLETYLPSVVGSEMPASWPQAALRAQAVAARTYALRQQKPEAGFDVSATVASQVYKGVEAETPSTREAVAATRGQVLTFAGELVNAVFHSSSGGSTENSGEIWSRQLPYLVSVPDYDASSPVSQWQQRLEPELLRRSFRETGGALRIDVLATTTSGRVRQARITGPAGTLVLTGSELRSRLGLRSTQVRFETLAPEVAALPGGESAAALPPPPPPLPGDDPQPLQLPQPALMAIGRGFGHGVGMSQWGAYAMALQGSSYQQILSHYYRGTELRAAAAP